MQAAIIAVIGQFIIHLLGSLVTEKYIAAVFFYIAEWLSKRTANGLDDDAVSGLKAAYYKDSPADRRELPRETQSPSPVEDAVIRPVTR